MKNRFFRVISRLTVLLLLITPALLLGSDQLNNSRNKPVNVVIIYVDDMGWKDLECYGSTFYETPNIDRLAREGVRFTDAYSACNVCAPSRHALMTGKYPARSHFTNIPMKSLKGRKLIDPVQDTYLDLSEVSFPEIFQAAGYYTAFFGKWHMGIRDQEALKRGEYGFDIHEPIRSEGGNTHPRIVEQRKIPRRSQKSLINQLTLLKVP